MVSRWARAWCGRCVFHVVSRQHPGTAGRSHSAARPISRRSAAARRDGQAGEWRVVEGDTGEVLALHGRYADLTIVGQPDPAAADAGRTADLSLGELMAPGRPLLV